MTDTARGAVGRALPRLEDRALLTGAARFLDDLEALPPRRQIPELRRFRALSWSDKVAALSAREG